ncbi:MAG TPA: DNA alkylation repair protein [Thermoanaerobaculia bacterium]|nr:DNA alkylation repair protein [Thermoanaerobaculia bacterium]
MTHTAGSVLTWLQEHSSKSVRDGMARYAIPSDNAYGVAMKDIKALGKTIGRDHALALALWDTGNYEARMLVSFVGDPERLTAAQMDRWCKDFDNWAYCDALSFSLFDRSPHAWAMVRRWAGRKKEFEKRTAFALLWALALHDKASPDARFLEGLELIEREATDERNFVKKAVNMALRALGRRSRAVKAEAVAVARRLAASGDRTASWNGRDALREFERGKMVRS